MVSVFCFTLLLCKHDKCLFKFACCTVFLMVTNRCVRCIHVWACPLQVWRRGCVQWPARMRLDRDIFQHQRVGTETAAHQLGLSHNILPGAFHIAIQLTYHLCIKWKTIICLCVLFISTTVSPGWLHCCFNTDMFRLHAKDLTATLQNHN